MGHEPVERDEPREQRIAQIVGGSDDEYARRSAWHGYLDDHLRFPFAATCRSVSREPVDVIDLSCIDDWDDEVLVALGGSKSGHDVPLSAVQPTDAAEAPTRQAIADWHYWVRRGYHFWTDAEESW